jgi:hypothetical protein
MRLAKQWLMNAHTTARMLAAEVLAVILPDAYTGDERTRSATVLLRDPDGHLEVRSMPARDVLADRRSWTRPRARSSATKWKRCPREAEASRARARGRTISSS